VRPAPFSYSKPASLAQALHAIAGGAMPLAGGQSLIQSMRLRTQEPFAVVDINAVHELTDRIEITENFVEIGALCTHRQLSESEVIRQEFPWLAKAALDLGDVQVRNRGTVLGNICWADPRANMAVALLASNATISVTGTKTELIPITEFFTGFRTTVLGPRLATSIRLIRNLNSIGTYLEFSRQRQDLALCNVCVVHDDHGTCVSVGGIHQRPIRLSALERILNDPDSTIRDLHVQIQSTLSKPIFDPLIDHHGEPAYKLHLAATLIERAINACLKGGDRD
jgi:aerobic carbon-monoxide dehydrogenase medium subunit